MKEQKLCITERLVPSDCRELTEAELILVNGGREVENSNAGVANAQVGDTVQNSGSIGYQPQGSQGNGAGAGSSSNPGYSYNGGYGNLPDSLNPNSPSFSAADMGYYQSMNSMAMMEKNMDQNFVPPSMEFAAYIMGEKQEQACLHP